MTNETRTLTLVREDGRVVELVRSDERLERLPQSVLLSRFMARRVARRLNEEPPSPYLRFAAVRLGFLRWAVVAYVVANAAG